MWPAVCECIFSDRCRTTNNMLGDAYGAAVVAALSKKELMAMDELNEKIKEKEEDKNICHIQGTAKVWINLTRK